MSTARSGTPTSCPQRPWTRSSRWTPRAIRCTSSAAKGSADSDYRFDAPGDTFSYSHGARWTSKGDNLVFSTDNGVSSVIRYELDEETNKVWKRWEFGADYGYRAMVLSEVHDSPTATS